VAEIYISLNDMQTCKLISPATRIPLQKILSINIKPWTGGWAKLPKLSKPNEV